MNYWRNRMWIGWSFFVGVIVASGPAYAKEEVLNTKFARGVQANMAAAENHYWGFLNCKRRDKVQGAPTSTIPLPGAKRTWVDGAGFDAHHIFVPKATQLDQVYSDLKSAISIVLSDSYGLSEWGDSSAQWNHGESSNRYPAVGLEKGESEVTVTFYPPIDIQIPDGNPCKP